MKTGQISREASHKGIAEPHPQDKVKAVLHDPKISELGRFLHLSPSSFSGPSVELNLALMSLSQLGCIRRSETESLKQQSQIVYMWMVLQVSPPASRMGRMGGKEGEAEEKVSQGLNT